MRLPPASTTARAPTEEKGAESEIGCQVVPESVVFQTPPVVRVQKARQRSAAQAYDEDALRIFLQRKSYQRRARIRQLDMARIVRLHDALTGTAALEPQRTQAFRFLRDHDMTVRRGLVIQHDRLAARDGGDEHEPDEGNAGAGLQYGRHA
jgi:hypothetical protein